MIAHNVISPGKRNRLADGQLRSEMLFARLGDISVHVHRRILRYVNRDVIGLYDTLDFLAIQSHTQSRHTEGFSREKLLQLHLKLGDRRPRGVKNADQRQGGLTIDVQRERLLKLRNPGNRNLNRIAWS